MSSAVTAAVSSPHYLATQAGLDILRRGGNAFDAAVAVSLAIGIVQPYHSGLGGGSSTTYLTANGSMGSVQARGSAPAQLTRERLLNAEGVPRYDLARVGPLASVVPGMARGLHEVHRLHGRMPWRDVCRSVIPLAADGFVVDQRLVRSWAWPGVAEKLSRFSSGTRLDRPLSEGERLVQPELADFHETLATDPDCLQAGPLASSMADQLQSLGGVLTASDLAGYTPRLQSLNRGTYRGWQIYAPGPPTIGGVQALLALQILDHLPLGEAGFGSVQHLHLVAEALKLSYMVRSGLDQEADAAVMADRARAAELAAMVRSERAMPFAQLRLQPDVGTSHFCVADAEGNLVSQTQTIGSLFGSGVVDRRTGLVLNDLVGDFSLQAGALTTQGILHGQYNLVGPGLEPASSQAPLFAVHPGTGDIIAAGAAGGPKIVSATVQALVNCIDFGMDARTAAAAPRLHCHGPQVDIEAGLGRGALTGLQALGHNVSAVEPSIGLMQLLWRKAGEWDGAADPRGVGSTAVILRNGAHEALRVFGWGTDRARY